MQNRNTEEKTGSESDDASDEESLSESPLEDSEAASVFSKACPAKSARFNGLLARMSKNSSWISHSSQNVNPLDLYSTRLMWLPLIARHTHNTHTHTHTHTHDGIIVDAWSCAKSFCSHDSWRSGKTCKQASWSPWIASYVSYLTGPNNYFGEVIQGGHQANLSRSDSWVAANLFGLWQSQRPKLKYRLLHHRKRWAKTNMFDR